MKLNCHTAAWVCAQVFCASVFVGFDPENPAVVAVYCGERAVMIILTQAPTYVLRTVEPDTASRWSVVQGRLVDAIVAAIASLQSSTPECRAAHAA